MEPERWLKIERLYHAVAQALLPVLSVRGTGRSACATAWSRVGFRLAVIPRQPHQRFHKKFGADIAQHFLARRVSVAEFQCHLAMLTPPGENRRGLEFPTVPGQGKTALLVKLQGWGILQQASEEAQVFHHHGDGGLLPRQFDPGRQSR